MPIIHVYKNCSGDWACWIETGIDRKSIQWAKSLAVAKDKNVAIVTALERAGIEFTSEEN